MHSKRQNHLLRCFREIEREEQTEPMKLHLGKNLILRTNKRTQLTITFNPSLEKLLHLPYSSTFSQPSRTSIVLSAHLSSNVTVRVLDSFKATVQYPPLVPIRIGVQLHGHSCYLSINLATSAKTACLYQASADLSLNAGERNPNPLW